MALSLGRLLGGAGVAATSMRQAEEAERVARQNQLATEERNRLELLRQGQQQVPEAVAPSFVDASGMPIMPTRQIAPPSPAPAPAAPGLAQPMSREQAAFMEANVEYPPVGGGRGTFVGPAPAPSTPVLLRPGDERLMRNAQENYRMRAMRLRDAQIGLDRLLSTPNAPARMVANQRALVARETEQLTAAMQGLERLVPPPAPAAPAAPAPAAPTAAPAAPAASSVSPQTASMFASLEQQNGLPQGLLNAVMSVESGGRPGLTSPAGAQGYFQFMPDTAAQYGVKVNDLASEASGAARMLADLLRMTGGDLDQALAGYNWGIGNVRRQGMTAMPPETRAYIPKVRALLQPGATVAAAAPAAPAAPAPAVAQAEPPSITITAPKLKTSTTYLRDPNAITQDMRMAMQQREEMARLARLYRDAGMGAQYMEARAKVMEMDNGMMYLQGMQGIQEFSTVGDPRRLMAVWSQYFGSPVGVQPRSDGLFDLFVDGQRIMEGVSQTDVTDRARSSFDVAFRKQKAEAAATAGMKQFESMLKQAEANAGELAKMIREIAVARTNGDINMALETMKQSRYDVKPTGAGDGTLIITPPGYGAVPYLFNPTGKTIEINGVKVQSNSAYPIAGLPTYGGTRPRG